MMILYNFSEQFRSCHFLQHFEFRVANCNYECTTIFVHMYASKLRIFANLHSHIWQLKNVHCALNLQGAWQTLFLLDVRLVKEER